MMNLKSRLHAIGAVLSISAMSSLCFAQSEAPDPAAADAPADSASSAEGEASPNEEADPEGQNSGEAANTEEPEETTGEEPGKEAAAVPAEAGEVDGATYRVRLRDLEQRVDELKEQIRRSHTRLSLLSDTILAGASGGARAEIEFVNDLSGAWRLVEAVFVLDGAVQYKKTDDTGVLAKQRTIPIFSGAVPTGDHTLQVLLKLQGHGFGVFSYLRGMSASLKSDHSFTISDGKVLELKVTAWEKGGPTTPVEEQPDVRFGAKIRDATETPQPTPASESISGKAKDGGVDGKAGVGAAVEK